MTSHICKFCKYKATDNTKLKRHLNKKFKCYEIDDKLYGNIDKKYSKQDTNEDYKIEEAEAEDINLINKICELNDEQQIKIKELTKSRDESIDEIETLKDEITHIKERLLKTKTNNDILKHNNAILTEQIKSNKSNYI
jgi:hypothetical protein